MYYVILDPSERGLIREGALFTNTGDKDTYDSFSVLLALSFTDSTYDFMSHVYKLDEVLSQTISKLKCKLFS